MLRGIALLALALVPATAAAQLIPVREEFRVNPAVTGFQRASDVAAHPGGFVVVWIDGFDLVARRYDATGTPLDGQIPVASPMDSLDPHVATDAAGNFVVVWERGDVIRARRFDAAGSPLGAEFAVSTTPPTWASEPDVAADPAGGFLVVWDAGELYDYPGDIYVRRYDASGSPLGPQSAISTDGNSSSPSVASDNAGRAVVVWFSGSAIFGRRLDATGAPLAPSFQVSPILGTPSFWPDVAADSSGAFVVTWQHSPGNGPIEGRRYDSTGTVLGGAFAVSTNNDDPTYDAHVAMDPTAGFVFTWVKNTTTGISQDVMMRRFDAAGVAQGPDARVNTYIANEQLAPAIASDGAGSVVVTWTSSDDGDSSGIFAQRYGLAAPVKGMNLSLRDDADATRRKIVFRSVDRSVSTALGAGIRLTTNGATLRVYNGMGSGEVACLPLPASGWIPSGNLERPTYRYRDSSYANGPCVSAVVTHRGTLKALCRARVQPIPYSLDEPQQGSIGVDVLSGSARYCALFGGDILDDSAAEQRFRAQGATPPASCPAAPPCP